MKLPHPSALSVASLVADPIHGGPLDGAQRRGTARGGERLLLHLGLWLHEGRVRRAGFQATTCATLIAYSELACRALEGGTDPDGLDADRLRAMLPGVHPIHFDRADLVARALRAALDEALTSGTTQPTQEPPP